MISFIGLAAAAPLALSAPDEPAPEISAPHWLNHFGQAPTNESLRGRAVLIEAWATW